jgi:predicted proteasome-type protease
MELFSDDELKQELMKLLFEKSLVGIRYDRAWVVPNRVAKSVHEYAQVQKENAHYQRERDKWSVRIRYVYSSIQGYEAKPALTIKRSPSGSCFIHLGK